MGKKTLALFCVLVFTLTFGLSGFTSAERPAPEVVEGEKYVSDHLQNASALYVAGKQVTLDNAVFYGAGFASDEDITAQLPNQYGTCAVVLGVGQDTDIILNNPSIQSDPESYANGVFAAAMSKITVNGGTITTNNSSGHGIDATYMGRVYASGTVIHTAGETSGALATDFGGGFVVGERLDCTTEGGSSPGIFCAGSSVIMLTDSRLAANKATGIVVAHDHAAVVLKNCEVDAAGDAVSGLQALPNAASSDGSSAYIFGGKLASRNGAVIGESGGRTVISLIGTECISGVDSAISVSGRSAGILTVNLWDTELAGTVECGEGSSLIINIYNGGRLSGEVTGSGTVEINVYDGGEYRGAFAVNQAGAGENVPAAGSFDDYLISCWASGSSNWTENRAKTYAETIEPGIIEHSAASLVVEGASAKPYDPEVFNPSENGVDLSLLNVGGAYGFTVDQVFGGDDGASAGAPADSEGASGGESAGGSAGDSAGAPADSEGDPAAGGPEADTAAEVGKISAALADNAAITAILSAGTTQAFSDEPVSENDLNTILQAGLAAPSAINQQPWFFAVITNPDIVNEITNIGGAASAPAEDASAGESADTDSASAGESAGTDSTSAGESAGSDGASAGAPGGSSKAGFGDSPVTIIIYKNSGSLSPNADFDCGLAVQNMYIAAASLGYGVKIISSPTGTLNGTNHDAICEKLGVDSSMEAVAVLQLGYPDTSSDAVSGASVRESLETKTVIIR